LAGKDDFRLDDKVGASSFESSILMGESSGLSVSCVCPVETRAKLTLRDRSSLLLFFIMG